MKIYKIKLFSHVLIVTLLIFNNIFSQTNLKNKILATAGSYTITAEEFRNRFEMTPFLMNNTAVEKMKEKFLNSIISEKLWAMEAITKGLDNSELYIISIDELKKMMIRDKLYSREVSSKVFLNNNLIQLEKSYCKNTLFFNYMISESKNEIDSIYSKLKNGASFISLLKNRKEFSNQKEPIKISCGDSNPDLEKLFFNLKEGQFTQPVKSEIGWTIYYLSFTTPELLNENQLQMKAKSIVKKREYAKYYKAFNLKYISQLKIDYDVELLYSLINNLNDFHLNNYGPLTDSATVLNYFDVNKIRRMFSKSELQKPILTFNSYEVSLNNLLNNIGFKGLKLKKDKSVIGNLLADYLKEFVRLEFLYRAAQKENIELSENDKLILEMWKTNYLAALAKSDIKDSISVGLNQLASELTKEELELLSAENVYNIFSTPSIEAVEEFITKFSNENFQFDKPELKFKDYKIQLLKSSESQIEFTKTTNIGLQSLPANKLNGPIFRDNNYYLIQKLPIESSTVLNDSTKLKMASQRAYFNQLRERIDSKTYKLAEKYGVERNLTELKNIIVSKINMVVMKYYGLGEKVLAVPFMEIDSDWIEKRSDNILP